MSDSSGALNFKEATDNNTLDERRFEISNSCLFEVNNHGSVRTIIYSESASKSDATFCRLAHRSPTKWSEFYYRFYDHGQH